MIFRRVFPFLAFIFFALLVGSGFYFAALSFTPLIREVSESVAVEEIRKAVSSPPPLRSEGKARSSQLGSEKIVFWTNLERSDENTPSLEESSRLKMAAALKIKDMFEKQYFQHVSPDGLDAASLAKKSGYEFLLVGENLALGNFIDEKDLVKAWMSSPGHRKNILDSKFTEIGVAASKGTFEGRSTWLAVQIFGRPTSACPKVDADLAERIQSYDQQLKPLKVLLDSLRSELENSRSKWGSDYRQKVDNYNASVDKYNALLIEVQSLVDRYNLQVKALNDCAAQ